MTSKLRITAVDFEPYGGSLSNQPLGTVVRDDFGTYVKDSDGNWLLLKKDLPANALLDLVAKRISLNEFTSEQYEARLDPLYGWTEDGHLADANEENKAVCGAAIDRLTGLWCEPVDVFCHCYDCRLWVKDHFRTVRRHDYWGENI